MQWNLKVRARGWVRLAVFATTVGICGCRARSTASRAGPAASAATTTAVSDVRSELYKELIHIAAVCEVETKQGFVDCKQGEQRKLASEFATNKRSRSKSVMTLANALREKAAGVPTVAANLLYSSAFRSAWGPEAKAGSVSATDADALLSAVLELPAAQARQSMPAAVHAEMLAGRADSLHAAVAKITDPPLLAAAVRHLASYGRLSAFAELQRYAQHKEPQVALAALESLFDMRDWTDTEQARICPWAGEMLGDERPDVAARAAALVGRCGGALVDQLLETREHSVQRGTFTVEGLEGLRDLCSAARRGEARAPSGPQCDRARKLLSALVETERIDEQVRALAFTSLAYQFPDANTIALAQRLSSGPPGPLVDAARRAQRRLQESLPTSLNQAQLRLVDRNRGLRR